MKKTSHGFVNQIFICLLATICFGGSVGLGAVWMRHQISVTANANRVLASQLVDLERRIADTMTQVDIARSPEVLRTLNEQMRLGLVPLTDSQPQTRVVENPVRRLIERSNRELFGEPVVSPSIRLPLSTSGVRFSLAQ